MRLVDLDPMFYGAGGEGIYSPTGNGCPLCPPGQPRSDCRTCLGKGLEYVPAAKRNGIGLSFLCPCQSCASQRKGIRDQDYQLRNYISFADPIDGGEKWSSGPWWQRSGETFETLQLSPSILSDTAKGGCGWHGHIGLNTPGEVTTC